MVDNSTKKSHSALALVCGVLSILLTVAFSSFCVILDLTGTLSRSVTAGLVFAGLIFGFVSIFICTMAHSNNKSKLSVVGLGLSVASVIVCVYSFILYLDMLYWWTNILNAVSPGLLK